MDPKCRILHLLIKALGRKLDIRKVLQYIVCLSSQISAFNFNCCFNKEEIDVSRALYKRVECAIRLIVGP